jgi:hypothetical protein
VLVGAVVGGDDDVVVGDDDDGEDDDVGDDDDVAGTFEGDIVLLVRDSSFQFANWVFSGYIP